jgi:sarcosine oxidase subunit beta
MPIDHVSDLPRTADMVIVGGGVVGASTAFHASRAGLRPLVVERRPLLCSLTTAAAAGGFRLQMDSEDELHLVRESVELFLDFTEMTGQRDYDPRVRQHGYLWVTTSEGGAERQRRLVAAQHSWGQTDVHLLGGEEAREAFPFLSSEVIQARFRQGDGLIDPRAVTFGLVAGSTARVATRCEVVGFDVAGDHLTGVRTNLGTVSTDLAVVAAGPFSGLVAGLAGVRLPVTTVQRQKLVMPEVPQVPTGAPMTVDDDTGAHWRPAFTGAFLLFTDPATPPSPPAEDLPIDQGFAFRLLDPESPSTVARVTPFWREVWEQGHAHWMIQAGQYTMTPDRRPLLGPTPIEGLHVNTGYSGHGVMGGPAGSRVLMDVVTGRVPRDRNPFRLDRPMAERPRQDLL